MPNITVKRAMHSIKWNMNAECGAQRYTIGCVVETDMEILYFVFHIWQWLFRLWLLFIFVMIFLCNSVNHACRSYHYKMVFNPSAPLRSSFVMGCHSWKSYGQFKIIKMLLSIEWWIDNIITKPTPNTKCIPISASLFHRHSQMKYEINSTVSTSQ